MTKSNGIFQSLIAQTITTTELPEIRKELFELGYCAKCNTYFPQIQYHHCGGEQMRRWDWIDDREAEDRHWGPKDEYLKIMADRLNYLEGDNERLRKQQVFVVPKDYAEPVPFDPAKSDARLDILLFTILGFIVVGCIYLTAIIIPEVL